MDQLADTGIQLKHIDLGGLGVTYAQESHRIQLNTWRLSKSDSSEEISP